MRFDGKLLGYSVMNIDTNVHKLYTELALFSNVTCDKWTWNWVALLVLGDEFL